MATGKKLINSPSTCVDEMLEGFVLSYPGLALHSDKRVVLQREVGSFWFHFKLNLFHLVNHIHQNYITLIKCD